MAIINFYERYGFSQTDELEKIQWIIDQKITDEENDPFGEGHSDKLFILQLAKDAFATTESRAKYDQDLADSMKINDPDGERKASFEKWYADAANYYANKQYDLAKTAIDRAMQYATPQTVDSDFYKTAAQIYLSLNLHEQALDFHNQSIVLSPDDANAYYLKAVTLYTSIKTFGKNGNWQNLKATCDLTIGKVIAQGSGYDMASKCYEFLAEMYFFLEEDDAVAEVCAWKAIEIINAPNPDACPTAKAVLDDIAARREAILDDIAARRKIIAELEQKGAEMEQKAAELEQKGAEMEQKAAELEQKGAEMEQKNAEMEQKNFEFKQKNDEIERQNSNLKNTVSSQRLSIKNADTYGDTGFFDFWKGPFFIAVFSVALYVALYNLAKGSLLFGLIIFLAIIVAVRMRAASVQKNRKIRDTLKSITEIEITTKKIRCK